MICVDSENIKNEEIRNQIHLISLFINFFIFILFRNISGVLSGVLGECQEGYAAVGDKCYSVPGLPSGFNFWTASEICSSLQGDLFHVDSIDEWHQLNTFLVDVLGTRPFQSTIY